MSARRNTMFSTVSVSVVIITQVLLGVIHTQEITGSETREPAIFLRPRNFNPHPYERLYGGRHHEIARSRNFENVGPVQFPPSSGERGSILDKHPYAAVAQKNRAFQGSQFAAQEQFAYNGLSRHPHAPKELDYNLEPKKHYAFSYTVRDHASGDDFSHSQQQKNGAVSGSYQVQLPDGRVQIVKYTADDNGYRADVSYTEDIKPIRPTPIHPQIENRNLFTPQSDYAYYKEPQPTYDYNLFIGNPHQEEQIYEEAPTSVTAAPPKSYFSTTTTTATPPSIQYKNYNLITGLPAPFGTVKTVFVNSPSPSPASHGFIEYADNYLDASSNAQYSQVVPSPAPIHEKPVSNSNIKIYYEKK